MAEDFDPDLWLRQVERTSVRDLIDCLNGIVNVYSDIRDFGLGSEKVCKDCIAQLVLEILEDYGFYPCGGLAEPVEVQKDESR